MFLKYIKLTNFKGFDDFSMSFENEDGSPRRMTMLLGENGTGKTNLLKAIALATAGSNALIELIGNPADWVKEGCDSCKIEFALRPHKHWNRSNITDEVFTLNINKDDGKADILRKNQATLIKTDKYIAENGYFSAAYGAARKFNFFNDWTSPYQTNINVTNLGNLFNPQHFLFPLTAWLIDLYYKSEDKRFEKEKEIFIFVTKKLNVLLRNIKFEGIDKLRKTILFRENGKVLPIAALSEGYQNMIAFMGDFLAKHLSTFEYHGGSWVTGHLDGNNESAIDVMLRGQFNFGLLLIDEIELHLHPEWQREFITFLREHMPERFQIILTTHSPIAAQQTEKGELFTLKKEDGKITALPFAGTPYKLLVDELLMSPAFGLETDESLKVENWKKEYRMLKANLNRNAEEEKRFAELKTALQMLPEPNGSVYFSEEHYHLLQKIEKELETKKL